MQLAALSQRQSIVLKNNALCTVLTDHSMAACRSFSILASSTSPFEQTERPQFGLYGSAHIRPVQLASLVHASRNGSSYGGKLVDKFRNTFFIICEFHNSLGNRRTDQPTRMQSERWNNWWTRERKNETIAAVDENGTKWHSLARARHTLADSADNVEWMTIIHNINAEK